MKDYSNNNPIYFKALDRMPSNFSSHVFMDRLRLFKISENEIKGGRVIQFLLQNCIRSNRSSWQKKSESNQIFIKQETSQLMPAQMTEQEMIDYLKGKGFKVLVPTWNEA